LEWPEALQSVALDAAGDDLRLSIDQLEAKLAATFSQSPFGVPALVAPVATELQAQLQAAIGRIQGKPIGAADARDVIRQLALTPKDKLLVYDSARQVVWAIQSIAGELSAAGEPLPDELAAKIAALSDVSKTGIEATLPAGRQVFIYPENLNAELNRKAAFNSEELARMLGEVASTIVVQPKVPAVAIR